MAHFFFSLVDILSLCLLFTTPMAFIILIFAAWRREKQSLLHSAIKDKQMNYDILHCSLLAVISALQL